MATMDDTHTADHVRPRLPERDRETAPQSTYSNRDVLVGFAVMVVGVMLTYGLGYAIA